MGRLVTFINGASEITCEEAEKFYSKLHIATVVNDGKDVVFIFEEGEENEEKRF